MICRYAVYLLLLQCCGRRSELPYRVIDKNATQLIKVAVEAALAPRSKPDIYGSDYPMLDGT